MPNETEDRFVALETKIAYQEKLLAELNEVLVEHTKKLSELEKRAEAFEEVIRDDREKPGIEKPPHY